MLDGTVGHMLDGTVGHMLVCTVGHLFVRGYFEFILPTRVDFNRNLLT
jgi:hypothetical protein